MTKPPKKKAKAKSPPKKGAARKSASPSKPKRTKAAKPAVEAEPPPAPKDFIGRPLTYTREKADAVLALMIDGQNPLAMKEACRALDIASGTFCGWVVEDIDGLADRYARAQKIRGQILADEIVAIADDASQDVTVGEDGKARVDHDHIQRSKLRVDTRKWVLAKVLPKIYGDKIQHTGDGGGPVAVAQVDLSKLTDEQLEALEQLHSSVAR
ncbi:MAG: hypothetical protein KJZ75_11280 [Hyphomonadaceae bacterium]|nr:hypothetical protein [Hyphomonadaceae bacterium]